VSRVKESTSTTTLAQRSIKILIVQNKYKTNSPGNANGAVAYPGNKTLLLNGTEPN